MLFSALPGASRHHWGTDFDFYDKAAITNKYQIRLQQDEYSEGGRFAALTAWLDDNMAQFGFYKPYDELGLSLVYDPYTKVILKGDVHCAPNEVLIRYLIHVIEEQDMTLDEFCKKERVVQIK